MKFRINFERKDYEDSFVVEGENIEEIKKNADRFFELRGLNADECNAWSEEIK